jgi:hypothetical protein
MNWRKWVLLGLIVWFALVTWWAFTPVSDTVPTGFVKNKDGVPVATAVTIQCAAPLTGSNAPTNALPTLKSSQSFQRTPCETPRENDRLIYAIDLVLVIGVLVVLIKTWKPSTEAPEIEDASAPA